MDFIFITHVPCKNYYLRNFTMLKNCMYVPFILCKAMKKAMMEDEKTSSISSSNGWQRNCNYFHFCQATSWYREIRNLSIKYKLNCQWHCVNIDDWYSVCITMEYLPKNRAKDDHRFLERCLLCCILSIWSSLLAPLHFGIASLQYPYHLSVGCMLLYGTQRYIDQDNLPCRIVKLSNLAKILLGWHTCTRTCYKWTFHVLKPLRLRFCKNSFFKCVAMKIRLR